MTYVPNGFAPVPGPVPGGYTTLANGKSSGEAGGLSLNWSIMRFWDAAVQAEHSRPLLEFEWPSKPVATRPPQAEHSAVMKDPGG